MSYMKKPRRVELLDEVRGLCILLMVAYHAAYDIVYLFEVDIPAFHWPILSVAQPLVAGTFIFISGIACRYSRSNLKRGFIALGLGLAISLVTFVFMPGQMIWFGILHFLGTAMILFALLRPTLDRFSVFGGTAVCALLFLLLFRLPSGYIGIPYLAELALPAAMYRFQWLAPLGLGGSGADYFPLIPWLFCFLAGSFVGRSFVSGDMPEGFYRPHVPFLSKVGRHTIIIYLLHQPVVYGVLWIIFRLIRG